MRNPKIAMVRYMYCQKADLWYCKYLWNYNTDQCEISVHYLDNESVSHDARWRTAAILKIVKSSYLSEKSSDFDEIWCFTADSEHDDSHVTKY